MKPKPTKKEKKPSPPTLVTIVCLAKLSNGSIRQIPLNDAEIYCVIELLKQLHGTIKVNDDPLYGVEIEKVKK
jgi:hypothetical protein